MDETDRDVRLSIQRPFQRPELSPYGRGVRRGSTDQPDAREAVDVEIDLLKAGTRDRRSQEKDAHGLAARERQDIGRPPQGSVHQDT